MRAAERGRDVAIVSGKASNTAHARDMTVPALPSPCRILLAAGVACALAAAPASADVPSLDAYAGQALVLGKPSHTNTSGHHGEGGVPTSSGTSTGSGPSAGAGASARPTHTGSTKRRSRPGSTPSSGTGRSTTETGPTQRLLATVQPTASALPFSALDVILLVAGLVCLLSVDVVFRRARRRG